jgi:hypothetical protein
MSAHVTTHNCIPSLSECLSPGRCSAALFDHIHASTRLPMDASSITHCSMRISPSCLLVVALTSTDDNASPFDHEKILRTQTFFVAMLPSGASPPVHHSLPRYSCLLKHCIALRHTRPARGDQMPHIRHRHREKHLTETVLAWLVPSGRVSSASHPTTARQFTAKGRLCQSGKTNHWTVRARGPRTLAG